MKWSLASVIAALALGFAHEASACPNVEDSTPPQPWEDATECDTFVPRPSRDGSDTFRWSLASHDARRDYLVKAKVPYVLADKLAVGGVPLQGQERSTDLGWYLKPALSPRVVFIFE